MKKSVLASWMLWILITPILAQAQPTFQLYLRRVDIPAFPAIQSFAWASTGSTWLIAGGRKDGIHPPQPFASFKPTGQHASLVIVDILSSQTTTVSLADLPASIHEQLSSVNMNFCQVNDNWWIIGGYGYSTTQQDHITFPQALRIHIPTLLQLAIKKQSILPAITAWQDPYFAITGGQLLHLNDTFFLAGGQTFTGRYNPHNGATFVQQYSDGIRRFVFRPNQPINQQIEKLQTWTSTQHLHRRDYNALPSVLDSNAIGFTLFSGVFQKKQDIPFLYPVDVTSAGFQAKRAFSQWLNQYHSAKFSLYSSKLRAQAYYFLGGMGQGYWSSEGTWKVDDEVPSTKTIGAIVRSKQEAWSEWQVGTLPDFLGAGAEFIPAMGVAEYAPGIMDADALSTDTTLIGYLVGGIRSTAPHVFFGPPHEQRSYASNQIYAIYAHPTNQTTIKRVPN